MRGRLIKERYRLGEQLGQGGMGAVWRAEDLNLHIDVAVKLIDPNFAESGEARARFEREALAAAQLRSMHIVLITDHGVDGDTPYIVMELLRGESLAARLQKRRALSFAETLNVFSQIAEALAFAHERKIVHRDLKPDNVFIVSERTKEVVKVLDFGVAKRLDAQSFGNKLKTHTGMLLGTPYYMSPEQTRGSGDIDHRADIWSFGVMVYECVTGRRPFEAETLPDLLMSICRDPFVAPSNVASVPVGFDEWFAQVVERDVNQRFQNIEAAADALNALSAARLVGPRAAMESVPTAVARTIRVKRNASRASRGEGSVKAAVSADTVNPSSVTSRGIAKIGSKSATLGLLLAGFTTAGGMLAYWLWPASNPVTVERAPEFSMQPSEGVPSVARPAVAIPTVSLAEAASAVPQPALVTPVVSVTQTASPAAKPAVVPIQAALETPLPATTKPKALAPVPAAAKPVAAKPQAVKPSVANPQVVKPAAPVAPRTKPFTGGF